VTRAHRSIRLRHGSQKVCPQATRIRGNTVPPYGSKQIAQLGAAFITTSATSSDKCASRAASSAGTDSATLVRK
jgi:hypothetical protein